MRQAYITDISFCAGYHVADTCQNSLPACLLSFSYRSVSIACSVCRAAFLPRFSPKLVLLHNAMRVRCEFTTLSSRNTTHHRLSIVSLFLTIFLIASIISQHIARLTLIIHDDFCADRHLLSFSSRCFTRFLIADDATERYRIFNIRYYSD